MNHWTPRRNGLRYVVERRLWADAFGAAYEFYRHNGRILRFWTKASAEAYAEKLNVDTSE